MRRGPDCRRSCSPHGAVAGAKLAQTRMLGATVLEVRGDFDAALGAAQELAARGTHVLVNSLNPYRREGQKTAVLRDRRGARAGAGRLRPALRRRRQHVLLRAGARRARARHADRLGRGRRARATRSRPRSGSASRCTPRRCERRGATRRRRPTDDEIVAAWQRARGGGRPLLRAVLGRRTGRRRCAATSRASALVVTITGHGLKDPATADRLAPRPSWSSRTPTRSPRPRLSERDRPRAGDLGEPRAGVRLRRRRARALERARGDRRRRRRRRGRGRRRARRRRDEPRASAPTRSSRTRPASGSGSRTGSRSSAGSARRRPRSRSASSPRAARRRRRGAPRSRARAREPRRQPRRRARRRRHAHVGGPRSPASPTTLPLAPVALVPRERTSTEASRRALPSTVPHADAAANAAPRRAARRGRSRGGRRRSSPPGSTTGCTSRTGPSAALEAHAADLPPGARGATLSGLGPDRDRLGRRRGGVRARALGPVPGRTTCSPSPSPPKGAL